jgi:hypothetical protein
MLMKIMFIDYFCNDCEAASGHWYAKHKSLKLQSNKRNVTTYSKLIYQSLQY